MLTYVENGRGRGVRPECGDQAAGRSTGREERNEVTRKKEDLAMARYGADYTTGRYTRRARGDYGAEYGDNRGPRSGWYSGRGPGGFEPEGTGPGGGLDRSGTYGPFDEFRGTNRPFDQFRGGFHAGRRDFHGSGRGPDTYSGFGGYGQERFGGYGGANRGYSHREMMDPGGRTGRDYDEGFGDRVRRGWNRFREEARDWMGRGYDRGW